MAIVIMLFSSSIYMEPSSRGDSPQTEQTDAGKSTNITFVKAANDAVQGGVTQLAAKVYLVLETLVLVDEKDELYSPLFFVQDEYVRTLFRVIISPNAP